MPTVGGSLARILVLLLLAYALYHFGAKTAAVERTYFAGGTMRTITVESDDPNYHEEIRQARRKAIPFYIGSGILGLAAAGYLRKAIRIYRRSGDGPTDITPRY